MKYVAAMGDGVFVMVVFLPYYYYGTDSAIVTHMKKYLIWWAVQLTSVAVVAEYKVPVSIRDEVAESSLVLFIKQGQS